MKKIVVDTNVYISSLITPSGSGAKVMRLLRSGDVLLLVSYPILKEYGSAALYPAIQKFHGLTRQQVEESIFDLAKVGKLIHPENSLHVVPNDPSDDKFVECAVQGEADFIISGDKHLKELKSYQGIRIVSPANFLALFK